MTEYILNPGDVITVASENPYGCLSVLFLGFMGLMLFASIGDSYTNKKPSNQTPLQANPEVQKRIEYEQEYLIDPNKIDNSPNIDSQLENIIDPDANFTAPLLNNSLGYQVLRIGGYDSLV